MRKVRCFIAVDITDKAVIREIEALQSEIAASGASVKMVEKENLHITLLFLGEIHELAVDEAKRTLMEMEFEPFEMELRGVGAFPSVSSPRVVWIDVVSGREELIEINKYLISKLRKYVRDKREFIPHLTVCRVKRKTVKLSELCNRNKERSFGVQYVDQVKLKESKLTYKGPIYSDLFVKRL
ncbi:MAG: RNA 2',3'-cyclic phosphodiesterase [Thermoproteota archaeon]|nr:MAG: RNA 2',3'-cyclic phosphodiesterase [Candidatus Korarchaeota archaeon]RLG56252.1 MAG: RNA 2',3'-cyclic phosphodiesterase [Candidatus Korarchaeota archaeon]